MVVSKISELPNSDTQFLNPGEDPAHIFKCIILRPQDDGLHEQVGDNWMGDGRCA